MSNKLRNITIGVNAFHYLVKTKYTSPGSISSVIIKVFLKGRKTTPLVINFSPLRWPKSGIPLYVGTHLFNTSTKQEEYVNLNEPKYIKACIEYGLSKGWTGENHIEQLDGIKILNDLCYITDAVVKKSEF